MRRWALHFFLVFSLWSMPAFGQPTPQPTPSEEESKKRYEEAVGLYNIQEFQKALAIFKELYLQTRTPELLVNIGQCHRFLKNYDDAISAFKTYLRESPQTSYRADIEKLISDIEVLKRAAATQPSTQSAAAQPSTLEHPNSAPVLVEPKRGPRPLPFFLAAGGLGVLSVASGGLALFNLNEAERLAEVGAGEPTPIEEIKDRTQQAKNFSNIANVIFAAGVASGGVGFYLYRTNKKLEAKLTPMAGAVNGAALTVKF